MIVRSFLVLFSLIVMLPSSMTIADVSSDDIRTSVDQYLAEHIKRLSANYGNNTRLEYQINTLDPRLSMADCPVDLSVESKSQRNIGRINIRVSCQRQNLWSLYVPVEIDVFRQVVSALRPIAKGTQLQDSNLTLQEIDVSQLHGSYFTHLDDVIGLQAKRLIKADMPLIASYLEQPLLIKRGDAVAITAESDTIRVKISGVALMDGHRGEQISVRNTQSKRVVEARVTAAGQVSITM